MASYTELNLDQGSTFSTTLDLTNDDGSPIDIGDQSFLCQIRKSYYSSSTAANVTVNILDSANGKIQLTLNSANTANIKAGRYLFDVKMTGQSTGTVLRIIEGIMTVTPQVSR
jgi:hypothetical protein